MIAVRTESLTHAYGDRPALRDLDLTIQAGNLTGFLGPNGSGKTTLFRILSTVMPPDAGRASVFGTSVTEDPSKVRRQLGIVFQESALDDVLTVRENLRIFGALNGLSRRDTDARIERLLEAMGLADRAGSRVESLSGGLRRRADLARGLVHAPRLLLLDEPTAGLDPTARARFWEALDRLRAEDHITVITTTHDFAEAARCDHVGILHRGELASWGRPQGLINEVGEEALWLTLDTTDDLASTLARFGRVERIGGRLRLVTDRPGEALAAVRKSAGDSLRAAELRKADLSDVYATATGERWTDEEVQP